MIPSVELFRSALTKGSAGSILPIYVLSSTTEAYDLDYVWWSAGRSMAGERHYRYVRMDDLDYDETEICDIPRRGESSTADSCMYVYWRKL